jgi:hypothetical protein
MSSRPAGACAYLTGGGVYRALTDPKSAFKTFQTAIS